MFENYTYEQYVADSDATPFSDGDAIDTHAANPNILSYDDGVRNRVAADIAQRVQYEAKQAQLELTPQAWVAQASQNIVSMRAARRNDFDLAA